VFLNALPMSAFNEFFQNNSYLRLEIMPLDIQKLGVVIDYHKAYHDEIINYIRHEGTIKLLKRLFNIDLTSSAGLYSFTTDDDIIIITLKNPERGKELTEVRESDIMIYKVGI